MPVMHFTIKPLNGNVDVNGIWLVRVTPEKLLKLTTNKQEANTMLNVYNVRCRYYPNTPCMMRRDSVRCRRSYVGLCRRHSPTPVRPA